MRSLSFVHVMRRAAVAASTAVLAAGVLLAAPQSAQAVLSSADLITALAYTTPTTQVSLRKYAPALAVDDTVTTFIAGDGDDVAATATPFFNDEYRIRLFHTAVSLIPTVSAKATWACSGSGDGVIVDADCSASGLVGGETVTFTITVTAENGDTNDYTFYAEVYASDATLSALTIDNGTLAPSFNAAVTSYSATTGQASIDIDPTANDAGATVVCKKGSATLTNCDGALLVGANTIAITVTAADGTTKKVYNVSITRVADTNAEIESISLSQGGLLTSASTHASFTRTNFTPAVIAYDLTSNDKDVNITVNLKHEEADFDCEVVSLASSSAQMGEADGDTCEFDITGADDDVDHRITITVHPDTAGVDKVYTFTVRLSATVTSDEAPALTPGGATLQVGSSVTFDPVAATLPGDFTNETRVMYQWYVCTTDVTPAVEDASSVPADCLPKSSAVGVSYKAASSDAGKHLIGALIGQPGSVLAYTASKEIVGAPGVAVLTAAPAPEEAGLVGAEIGTEIDLENIDEADFTGITDVATEVDFQWYRCTAAATTPTLAIAIVTPTVCKKIPGATTDSYEPADNADPLLSDSGKFIRARLILSPSGGSEYMVFTRSTNKVYGPAVNTGNPGSPSAPGLTPLVDTKITTASNGTWVGYPVVDTTVAENFSYQWFFCHAAVSVASNTDPATRTLRNGDPRCELISGETSKTFTVTTEFCFKYLMVGVSVDNTDFRGKGGTSQMRYSATSTSTVAGSACD